MANLDLRLGSESNTKRFAVPRGHLALSKWSASCLQHPLGLRAALPWSRWTHRTWNPSHLRKAGALWQPAQSSHHKCAAWERSCHLSRERAFSGCSANSSNSLSLLLHPPFQLVPYSFLPFQEGIPKSILTNGSPFWKQLVLVCVIVITGLFLRRRRRGRDHPGPRGRIRCLNGRCGVHSA